MRALRAGAPEDPAPRRAVPGSVEVWSRVTVVDGVELHLEPGRAGLSAEQARALVRDITALYRHVRSTEADAVGDPAVGPSSTPRENDDA